MHKALVKFVSIFIPIKKYRRKFRNKFLIDKKENIPKYSRYFEGENNVLHCPDGFKLNCAIIGNGNEVYIEDNDLSWNTQLDVYIGLPEIPVNNCVLHIGKNFSSNGTMIRICEDSSEVIIGDDCMFSDDISIWASDTHTITDISGNILNIGKFIHIGNHVWLGHGASILKNSTIGDNCVVGTHAIVSGSFVEKNCVIAGSPAKIVKEKINWNRQRPKQYIQTIEGIIQ